jgi:integrase
LQDARKTFQTALERARIEDFRIHDLRHTFASTAVNSGVPLDVVQLLLGHSDPTMTQRYAHHDSKTLRRGSDAVAGAFRGIVED